MVSFDRGEATHSRAVGRYENLGGYLIWIIRNLVFSEDAESSWCAQGNKTDCSWFLKSGRAKIAPGRYKSKVGIIYNNMLVWVLSLALVAPPIVIDLHGKHKKSKAFWEKSFCLYSCQNSEYDRSPDSLTFLTALHSIRSSITAGGATAAVDSTHTSATV